MPKINIPDYLKNLTKSPGVYKFLDKSGNVIYVGKAKNLRNRVRSYFNTKHSDEKTKSLVSNIDDISIILVETESDALLLENNLIKKFKPKYNILLKDGKSYPWICIKNERFPRIFLTRKVINDGSEYFGPYTNIKTINTLLDLINNIYPIRKTNYNLPQKIINDSKIKLSLRVLEKNGHFIILGFEDIYRGGDQDYNDLLFAVDIGAANVQTLIETTALVPEPQEILMMMIFGLFLVKYLISYQNAHIKF